MSAQPGVSSPMVQEDPANGVNAALGAIRVMAGKAAGASSAAEAKDYAQGALAFAQMIVLLDPTRDQQGTPLDHQLELVKAQAGAAAPSPVKRIRVNRGADGRATSYEQEG